MAETRAQARALRDAVNFAVTAVEELGDQPRATGTHRAVTERETGLVPTPVVLHLRTGIRVSHDRGIDLNEIGCIHSARCPAFSHPSLGCADSTDTVARIGKESLTCLIASPALPLSPSLSFSVSSSPRTAE